MNACMHGLTVVCVCVCVYVYVVGWFGRLVCRVEQSTFTSSGSKEPLRIAISLQIVQRSVSLEEEHVDDCEMSECMTLRLCPPCISS